MPIVRYGNSYNHFKTGDDKSEEMFKGDVGASNGVMLRK